MKTISQNKIEVYLKLGRILSCFVKINTYFERNTFDWIKLEKSEDAYRATLVRSFDQGNMQFTDVMEFETVNNLDEEEHLFIEGTIEEVRTWIKTHFGMQMNGFYQLSDLNCIYQQLVEQHKLRN